MGEGRSFVVADMPGLIPGAHKGVGLGTRFLKHIERTKIFVHLIDGSGISGRDPRKDFDDIELELKMYDQAHGEDAEYKPLYGRPQIIVINKADLLTSDTQDLLLNRFQNMGLQIFMVSAVTGQGIQKLIQTLGEVVIGEKKA